MSSYPSVAAEAGDKYLETLAQGQDRIIEYVRASREFIPHVPETHAPAMPFQMPSIREFADVQFSFANKLLDLQHKFYRRLYQAPTAKAPVKAAQSGTAKTGAAKSGPTKKRTARKTTAKPTPVS